MDLQDKDCQTGRGPPHHQFHNDYQSDPHASPLTRTLRSQQLIANKPMLRIAVYLMSGVILTMEVEHTATTQDIIAIIQSEKELGLGRISSPLGQPVFALWLCSQQLEVQLGPTHKPLELGARWPRLLAKYGSDEIRDEEQPVLYYRRNIFLARSDEEQVKEAKTLELLYAEARHNVLEGRYPCEGQARYASLGALQARIELGPYNSQIHTLAYFRRHKGRFLPHHFTSPTLLLGLGLGLGLVGGKGALEVRLLDQYKRIPPHTGTNAHPRKLIRKYLEFCWGLPCYGATFFHGQIERPVRGLASWITHRDLKVLVAINALGVYIVDDAQCSLLLGLKYSELSWEMAKPSDERNPDCLPCLFLQFPVRENGAHVFKILQVFSRQAVMMDTLISGFVEESRKCNTRCDMAGVSRSSDITITTNANCFTNKLSKFTLATFDDQGRCIGQMGSWSFQ
ncbi:putative FERM domain-containing protein FRMD8P1 [Neodiprion pinetum]|uniref:FERM domain-containing protein 8 n=1 Tax=Neodiprion lecontei TaxID=441921 RepID=A0A6J0B6D4_NEOLC|nr:putative FERM domain-containing protein FRMD8P1 [Neodiprion lecontei]XP_046490350.1 putative FERM domain-containing protein FRMD8P1 [Neodiprion pinetum]